VVRALKTKGKCGILGKFLDKLFIHRWAEKMLLRELENLKSILEKQ
jgi:hypothetical protein